ncbi:hypothetical protein ACE2AJ_00570 [Aquihabitans daechungensis]|uniref:hypothetical protein n=1 Tax=Aquihabitans daechungensis TaxID=1052257 RepID=UPI003BA346F1
MRSERPVRLCVLDGPWDSAGIAAALDEPADSLHVIRVWDDCPVEELAAGVADLADRVGATDVFLVDPDGGTSSIAVADRLARTRPAPVIAGADVHYAHAPEAEPVVVPGPWAADAEDAGQPAVWEAAARRRWEAIWLASARDDGPTGTAVHAGLELAREALERVAAVGRGDGGDDA